MSRETHRQVSVLAVAWVGCMLPCCYLHNRVRKHITSQSETWRMVTPPSLTVYANMG